MSLRNTFSGFFNKLRGVEKVGTNRTAPAPRRRKTSAWDWERDPTWLPLDQMTRKQRSTAEISQRMIEEFCVRTNRQLANFQGPFLQPVEDSEAAREGLVAVLGPPTTPGYEAWEIEYGGPEGFLRGFGDSEGRFRWYMEGLKPG